MVLRYLVLNLALTHAVLDFYIIRLDFTTQSTFQPFNDISFTRPASYNLESLNQNNRRKQNEEVPDLTFLFLFLCFSPNF